MIWILLIAIVVAAYVFRVPLLAKILGQPEERIRRQIERKKR